MTQEAPRHPARPPTVIVVVRSACLVALVASVIAGCSGLPPPTTPASAGSTATGATSDAVPAPTVTTDATATDATAARPTEERTQDPPSRAPSGTLAAPTPYPSPADVALRKVAVDVGPGFRLTVSTERVRYRLSEPVNVVAERAYVGPQDRVTVSGASSGLIDFRFVDLQAPYDTMAGETAMCAPFRFDRGQVERRTFVKQGGFEHERESAYWKAFFDDPEVRPPPGRWRLVATVQYFQSRACRGPQVSLAAGVVVEVAPD